LSISVFSLRSSLSHRRSFFIRALLSSALIFGGCSLFKSATDDRSADEIKHDNEQVYHGNVSMLKSINRLSSAHYATTFWWWDSLGKQMGLSDYYGSVIVLHFWNTDCKVCLDDQTDVAQLTQSLKDSGVVALGVVLKESGSSKTLVDSVYQNVRSRGITYQQIIGNNELSYAYEGIEMLPTTVIISREGRVLATLAGRQNRSALDREIRKAMYYEAPK
jgi:peroxiredoxin